MNQKNDRRQFLKSTFGVLGTFFLGYKGKLFPKDRQVAQSNPVQQTEPPPVELPGSELYEGFLLLPEETLIPSFVQQDRGIMLGQVGDSDDPTLIGETIQFKDVEDLKSFISFPLFTLKELPTNIEFIGASVTQFTQSREIWKASIYFGRGNEYSQLISVHARPMFHRPFPVWPVRLPYAHDEGPITPEKINISAKSMLLLPSASGYLFQWIEQDILYSLAVEHDRNRKEALTIAESLTQL